MKFISLIALNFLSAFCFAQHFGSEISFKDSNQNNNPIWIIKYWGRLYDPVSVNLFNPRNIASIQIGDGKKKGKSLITVYLKDGIKLISYKEFGKRYNINKKDRKALTVYIDSTKITYPKKLLFDPSQIFVVTRIKDSIFGKSDDYSLLRISIKK
jgi:hypothetical protein